MLIYVYSYRVLRHHHRLTIEPSLAVKATAVKSAHGRTSMSNIDKSILITLTIENINQVSCKCTFIYQVSNLSVLILMRVVTRMYFY